jgi:hypothetical protein
VTASGFLRLGTAWQQWVPGAIVLVAAAISSRSRSLRVNRGPGAAASAGAVAPSGARPAA